MKKVPSYLKGLAEDRARADGEIMRLERLQAEIAERIAKAQEMLEACDVLIKKFDGRLTPALITPIQAWQGRYGKRGALIAAIRRNLEEAYPGEITTPELTFNLRLEFGIEFESREQQERWRRHSVLNRLQDMVKAGQIERLHENGPRAEVGIWRWIPASNYGLEGVEVSEPAPEDERPSQLAEEAVIFLSN